MNMILLLLCVKSSKGCRLPLGCKHTFLFMPQVIERLVDRLIDSMHVEPGTVGGAGVRMVSKRGSVLVLLLTLQ